MSEKSTITIREFLKINPHYIKVIVNFVIYYDDTTDIFVDNLTNNDYILNRTIDKVTLDIVHFHHYEISIITNGITVEDFLND